MVEPESECFSFAMKFYTAAVTKEKSSAKGTKVLFF
jgi:hypothetical protein